MRIILRGRFSEIIAELLTTEAMLCTEQEMMFQTNEVIIIQETDRRYPEWVLWIGCAVGVGLVSGHDIFRI